jgi:hypothetical protein
MTYVSGIVFDETGTPLDGANVYYVDSEGEWDQSIPGTYTAPLAGIFPGGYFSIQFVPFGTLQFSFVGFQPVQVELPGTNPNAPHDYFLEIDMEPGSVDLPPVIITPDEPAEISSKGIFALLLGAVILMEL